MTKAQVKALEFFNIPKDSPYLLENILKTMINREQNTPKSTPKSRGAAKALNNLYWKLAKKEVGY